MNLLPIATPTAPANLGPDDPATAGSGDFTALLAMLVGAASTTLPIDRPPIGRGDPESSPLPSPATPTAEPGATPSLPEMPALVSEMPAAAVPEMPAAPVAETPAAAVAEAAPVTPPVVAAADAPGLLRVDPLRAEPAELAVRAEPAQPAVPAQETERAVRAQPAAPAVPAQGAESAVRMQPAAPAVPAQGAESAVRMQPAAPAVTAQGAESAARMQPAEPAVPSHSAAGVRTAVESSTATPTRPAQALSEHEHRPETMTLPEAVRFERPPLGNSASPGRHDTERRQEPVPAVSPLERPQVDVPASEPSQTFPSSTAAGRPSAPAGPPATPSPVVPLVAANRAEVLARVDAPAASPAELPAVPNQIVSAVVPLHGRGDGRHEVTLELRPDNLGTIRVEVVVEHQTVHLTLHAAEPATSRLLSAALPDLRASLADAGLTAGQVGVGLDGEGGAGHRRSRPQAESEPRLPDTRSRTSTIRTARPAAAGRLDLFL